MEAITNESDVEQKFIAPLLVQVHPIGLGYKYSDFRTKENLRKLEIGKGSSRKVYFPDYVVISNGLPIMVIEAKSPKEDILVGYREARLYACEINGFYPSNINPCSLIVATNYLKTCIGTWDTEEPEIVFSAKDMCASQKSYYEFIKRACKENIENIATEVLKKIRGKGRLIKPVYLLGGKAAASEVIGDNSFGTNIAIDYKYVYNPSNEEDRKNIVLNAYVESKKRDSHVNPIEKIIRRASAIDITEVKKIMDTGKPVELLETIKDIHRYKHEVCILIGSVGSGKSTFVDYLHYKALDESTRASTVWINLNMNDAPESSEIIYSWVLEQAISQIKEKCGEDIDDYKVQLKIFHNEIKTFEKGPISIYGKESEKYKSELYDLLSRLLSDKIKTLNALLRYYYAERKISPIIVLDNSDKRSRDLQLLMFDVANWIKNSFHCMVFLPLRDTTFDQYRRTPPLDTAIKDLMFRIDPPFLDQVLQARLDYVVREVSKDHRDFHYTTRNGMRILCKSDDVVIYLKAILQSIFQTDLTKRLFIGLAGRDIRKGLEIFLDFCKSGYILEDTIVRIRQNAGNQMIPVLATMQIIIKGTKRFYDDESSRVKNVYKMSKDDELPDPFAREAILEWLAAHRDSTFAANARGYHRYSDLKAELMLLGHAEARIEKEVQELILADCIVSETQIKHIPEESELVSITAGGLMHLELIQNIFYLAFISEDTLYNDESRARKIADNLIRKDSFPFLSHQSILENARSVVNYLFEYYDNSNYKYDKYLDEKTSPKYSNIFALKDWMEKRVSEDDSFIDYERLKEQYPKGSIIDTQVIHVEGYGVFTVFGLNGKGFSPTSLKTMGIESGDIIKAKILGFNEIHKRFDIEPIKEA